MLSTALYQRQRLFLSAGSACSWFQLSAHNQPKPTLGPPSWQQDEAEEGPGLPWQEVKASLATLGQSPSLRQAAWYCLSKQLQQLKPRWGGCALRKAPVTKRAVLKHTDTQGWEHAGRPACTAKTHSSLQALLSVLQPTPWPPQLKCTQCFFLWVAQAGWSMPSLCSGMALRSLFGSVRKKC